MFTTPAGNSSLESEMATPRLRFEWDLMRQMGSKKGGFEKGSSDFDNSSSFPTTGRPDQRPITIVFMEAIVNFRCSSSRRVNEIWRRRSSPFPSRSGPIGKPSEHLDIFAFHVQMSRFIR
jgi:hypothetical protein